jgi:hypothetical protein
MAADYVLERRVWLARPRADVFSFFADPANLARLVPRSLRLRILAAPAALTAGAVIDLQIGWPGLPVTWRAFIREWDPPFRFVDVQVRGPYARWEHRHRFLEDAVGTCVEDRVTYRLPLGPLGRLAHRLVVGGWLGALWDYRTERLGALVGPIRPEAG